MSHHDTDSAPVYLTVAEAAAYLRLSKVTLDQWRSRDTGPPFVRLGRAIRYRRDALDSWAQRSTPTNAA